MMTVRGSGARPAGRGRALPAGGRRVRGAGAGLSGTYAPRAGRRQRRPEGGEGEVRAGSAPPPPAWAPAEGGLESRSFTPAPAGGALLGCRSSTAGISLAAPMARNGTRQRVSPPPSRGLGSRGESDPACPSRCWYLHTGAGAL